ncbi:MAG: PorV/PorQ family protein [candidate division KSB1 bacterium]
MRKNILIAFLVGAFALLTVGMAFGQNDEPLTEKRAQTGMKFLSVSLDARASAMGNTMTSQDQVTAMAMFYNPGALGWLKNNVNVSVGQTRYIVDFNYSYGAVAFRPANGSFGVFGLNVMTVDYGDFEETIRDGASESGYRQLGTFSPSAMSVGLGYGFAVSDRFTFGANLKYVREDLGAAAVRLTGTTVTREENKANTMAFDFGILYRTGWKSLNFGMTARNFAKDLTYAEESFELPLTFRIGLSMDLLDLTGMAEGKHAMLLSVDTERPRDFQEHVNVGAEYLFSNVVALRGGYAIGAGDDTEEGASFGAGLQTKMGSQGSNLKVDYSYTSFGVFDNVNRFTFSFAF